MKTSRVACKCSFCGKSQEAVHRLVAGPGGVYICNECVALCVEIFADEQAQHAGGAQWVKGSHAHDNAATHASRAAEIEARMQAILTPLVDELAAARAAVERLASENGALGERVRALESAHRPES